ncbi:MAG: hypothetical protein LBL39_07520, partial [Planctomycetaceae bacterium]|nr:hypothetical protein [Planctomycetaceae bacterium]
MADCSACPSRDISRAPSNITGQFFVKHREHRSHREKEEGEKKRGIRGKAEKTEIFKKMFVTVHVILFHGGKQTNRASGVIMHNRWCSEAEPPV